MPASHTKADKGLLRISELSALTDVPAPSIKFYIKEGLLPPPLKTSRNMAYYDESFVDRIRFIKELQTQHFLPLRVIREILSGSDGNGRLAEAQVLLELKGSFLGRPVGERSQPLAEPEVITQFNTYELELEKLRGMGILNPSETGGQRVYDGDDLDFLAALENNRRLGFRSEIGFQVDDLAIYLRFLEDLAREEVKLLISRTASKLSSEEIKQLAERGIREFGPLLMVLRRKMILKVLSGLRPGSSESPRQGSNGSRKRRKRNGRSSGVPGAAAAKTSGGDEEKPGAGSRGLS
ncbi:MAG: MerR family transcriptional regulator [Deltaproteobacteria bacterium]|nr:MerR family transcriptional regulator [Deltaproteobacteria bacterium]